MDFQVGWSFERMGNFRALPAVPTLSPFSRTSPCARIFFNAKWRNCHPIEAQFPPMFLFPPKTPKPGMDVFFALRIAKVRLVRTFSRRVHARLAWHHTSSSKYRLSH